MIFKVGDRVRHIDFPDIAGTVAQVHDDRQFYFVEWDEKPDPADTPFDDSVLVRA